MSPCVSRSMCIPYSSIARQVASYFVFIITRSRAGGGKKKRKLLCTLPSLPRVCVSFFRRGLRTAWLHGRLLLGGMLIHAKVPPFFPTGLKPVARATRYPAHKNTFGDLLGAAWLANSPLRIRVAKSKQPQRKRKIAKQQRGHARASDTVPTLQISPQR